MIAEGTGNQHHAIQQIIQKYEDDISDFGQVAFEMRAVKYARGTNQEKVYLLNEEQATFYHWEDRCHGKGPLETVPEAQRERLTVPAL